MNEVNIGSKVQKYLDGLPTAKLLTADRKLNADGKRLSESVLDFIRALLDGVTSDFQSTQTNLRTNNKSTSARLDAIDLTDENPVGPLNLEGLATAHTILIVGPNGAGKSSVLRPLKTRTNPGGKAKCLTANEEVVTFDATGVQNNIAFVTSVDLLSKIDSLNDALAIAAGASRYGAYVQVLKATANQLSKEIKEPTSPPSWSHLNRFIDHDIRCKTLPRTFDHYVSIGNSLAKALDVSWNPVSEDASENERLENERALMPVAVAFSGRQELQGIVNSLVSLRVEGAASRAEQALLELAAACKEIIDDYAIKLNDSDVLSLAERLMQWLRSAIETFEQLADARNTLKACQKLALQYIAASHPEPTECPICDNSISAQSVSSKLSSQIQIDEPSGIAKDPDLKALEMLRTALRRIKDSKDNTESLINIASQCWTHNHQLLQKVTEQLRNLPTNWHQNVKSVGTQIQQICEAWVSAYPRWSSAAEASALNARNQALSACTNLQNDENALNNGHNGRLLLFNQLQSLGALIWVRRDLNKTPWTVDAEQEAKNNNIRQCVAQLKHLSLIYEGLAENAINAVVTDKVQARFAQMVNKLQSVGHPHHVTSALMKGGDVSTGDAELSNSLSEGQRVLINVAARMTIASVVIGEDDHKPGWIVFDEPTNGLDPEAVSILAEYIGGFTPEEFGGQIIVSTFDNEFASLVVKHSNASARRVKQINLRRFNSNLHEHGLQWISINDYAPVTN